MSYIVATENLTERYGKRTVVEDLNLRIPAGCVYGFGGPPGWRKYITMYEDYARGWSITELASIANMSRASFVATLKDVVRENPGQASSTETLSTSTRTSTKVDRIKRSVARDHRP